MFTGGSPGGRAPRGRCARAMLADHRRRRGGRARPIEAEARAPGSDPPGSSASRVRRSRSARVWSRFLSARVAFSCRVSIWCSARPARAVGGRAQGGVERAQALLDRRHLALERPRARGRTPPRPPGRPPAPSARAAPRGRPAGRAGVSPSASSARACARLDQRSRWAAAAATGRGMPKCGVRGADLRVVRDLRGSAHVGGGRQQQVLGQRAQQHARAPVGRDRPPGSRSASVERDLAARARAPRSSPFAHAQRAPLAVHEHEEVQEARRAPAPAGGSRRPAAAGPPRAASREVGERSRDLARQHGRHQRLEGGIGRDRARRGREAARRGAARRPSESDDARAITRAPRARPRRRGAGPAGSGRAQLVDAAPVIVSSRTIARRGLADGLARGRVAQRRGSGRPRRARWSSGPRRSRGRRRPPRTPAPPARPRRSCSARGDLDRGQGLVEDVQRAAEEPRPAGR